MSGIIFIVYTLSISSIIGMIYNILALQRFLIYPPRNILKERAKVLGGGGVIFFVLGLILQSLQ
ncbi:hypothetical protein [Bacillus massilinigeriensis]|uniref:hypothetical protein n=1 Tax=Bacillus massilionigeriensis TaxID=1805475 RepID=UPI00096B48AB|nr:hypothetical protein [Bacillus massilionigeriensis]